MYYSRYLCIKSYSIDMQMDSQMHPVTQSITNTLFKIFRLSLQKIYCVFVYTAVSILMETCVICVARSV